MDEAFETVQVVNSRASLVVGPDMPGSKKPYHFKPGANNVPTAYWEYATSDGDRQAKNFRRCILDPRVIYEASKKPTVSEEVLKNLKTYPSLEGFAPPECEEILSRVSNAHLLIRWGQAEMRRPILQLIVKRLQDLGHLPKEPKESDSLDDDEE